MASLSIEPLTPGLTFGARVEGLRLCDLADKQITDKLRSLWIERGVLLFTGIEPSRPMHLELSRCFGSLEAHPLKASYTSDNDEITKIGYSPSESTVYEVDGRPRGGWLPWHSDLVYVAQINRGGILRPIALPDSGGETGFIDQIAAYEVLPQRLKQRIEGLHVAYRLDLDATHQRFGQKAHVKLIRLSPSTINAIQSAVGQPAALHPMVYEQAETKRKVLNISPWFATGIHELPGPEGDDLLAEVIEYGLRDDLAYFHEWKSLDEMLLWDNWRMVHCANGVPAHLSRSMERTTIAGDYALGRWQDSAWVDDGAAVVMV